MEVVFMGGLRRQKVIYFRLILSKKVEFDVFFVWKIVLV